MLEEPRDDLQDILSKYKIKKPSEKEETEKLRQVTSPKNTEM